MSTLSAARADNFYFPPNWDPSKTSLSEHTGHTKGRNQYEQKGLIRFELPFDGWCAGCGRHVGKGVRFNASKDADGKHHSTTIWWFSMQCPSCTTKFVIKTDPAKSDYAYVSGIRRKVESYDADEADGARELVDTDHRAMEKALAKRKDPMAALEKRGEDAKKAKRLAGELADDWARAERFADDYDANRALRRRHRADRKDAKARDGMAARLGLACELLPPDAADADAAKAVRFARPREPPPPPRRKPTTSIFGRPLSSKAAAASALATERGIDPAKLAIKPRAKGRTTTLKKTAARRRAA